MTHKKNGAKKATNNNSLPSPTPDCLIMFHLFFLLAKNFLKNMKNKRNVKKCLCETSMMSLLNTSISPLMHNFNCIQSLKLRHVPSSNILAQKTNQNN